jgi:hypothetical protein
MRHILLITFLFSIIGLTGCASNGVGSQPLRVQDDAGMTAAQSSARNIAPITSYINTRY